MILFVEALQNLPDLADNLGLVMSQIVSTLQASGVTTSEQVQFSLLDEPFADVGFPQLVVTPGDFLPIGGQLDGGGRYTTGLRGSVDVTAWVRVATDKAYLDTDRLTDQSRGAYQICAGVVDVMEELFPVHPVTGAMLTEEGLKVISMGAPKRGTKPKAAEGKSPEIAGVSLTFEVTVALALDGTV